MDTITAINKRRSVKHYDPNHTITESEIRKLLELALLSPTSFNMQNWRFVVITDPEKRQAIRAASWDQAQVTEASLLIILCANLQAHENGARYWINASKPIQDTLVPMIAHFYKDKPQLQRDEAMRSIGIAVQTLMLAAKSMNYDSCPMIGFDPVKVAEIIQLPEHHIIGMMLPVGKAIKEANPRGGQLDYSEVVFKDSF